MQVPQPRPSPLEGLTTALVYFKATAAEGHVQEGHAVDFSPPGHIEDPCHTGIHQGHTGSREECPEHYLGEVALPLGDHGGCKGTEVLRAREAMSLSAHVLQLWLHR